LSQRIPLANKVAQATACDAPSNWVTTLTESALHESLEAASTGVVLSTGATLTSKQAECAIFFATKQIGSGKDVRAKTNPVAFAV